MGTDKKQHSAGWYAGALVFWLLTAWLTTVGLSSIIPQIFWPAGDAHAAAGTCASELRALRTALTKHASQYLEQGADEESEQAFVDDWDERFARAKPACESDDERAAWKALNRARFGVQGLLERFSRDEAPRLRELDRLLGPASAAHPHESDVHDSARVPHTSAHEHARAQLLEDDPHE